MRNFDNDKAEIKAAWYGTVGLLKYLLERKDSFSMPDGVQSGSSNRKRMYAKTGILPDDKSCTLIGKDALFQL